MRAQDTSDTIAVLSIRVVSVPAETEDATVAALRAASSVDTVTKDRVRTAEGTPDDPAYNDQWALPKIGWDTARDTVTPTARPPSRCWTPVSRRSTTLVANIVPVHRSSGPATALLTPTATELAMASIIAADTNNGIGIAGVGYRGVKVMPITVLDAFGHGQDSDVINGVVYAVQHHADVILMAFRRNRVLRRTPDRRRTTPGTTAQSLWRRPGNEVRPTRPSRRATRRGRRLEHRPRRHAGATSNYGDDTFLAAPGERHQGTAHRRVTCAISGTSAACRDRGRLRRRPRGERQRRHTPASSWPTGPQRRRRRKLIADWQWPCHLSRALADAATESLKPAGAAPSGAAAPSSAPSDRGERLRHVAGAEQSGVRLARPLSLADEN
jgi:hypothetical protein